jgi:hypothetical protein
MPANLQTSSEPGLATTMSGIVHDVQELVKQQLALFKAEISSDFRKAREASISLAAGVVALIFGAGLLCVMSVHLIKWLVPSMELWVCYLLVGLGVVLVGAVLVGIGWKQFQSIQPTEQAVDALKENLEWKTMPK